MVRKKTKKKIRSADIESIPDIVIDRAALFRIKDIACRIARDNAFPKNLQQDEIQYWLMFNGLSAYLGERKVPCPFEINLETQDRD